MSKNILDNRIDLNGTVPYFSSSSEVLQEPICQVTPDGAVVRNGVDITDDDAAMAQAFRDFIESQGTYVRPKEST